MAVEAQLGFIGDEPQQEPALLLADAAVAHILARQAVAQPAAGRAEHLDVPRLQADLLVQLAEQRLLDLLAAIDAALRKLPAAAPDPAAEEHLPGPRVSTIPTLARKPSLSM